MYNTLAKFMNPNCALYHEKETETDAQYATNIQTVIAPGMYYIWRHGASDIQVLSRVGSKSKREIRQQEIVGSKRGYIMEGQQLGASQGGVLGDIG